MRQFYRSLAAALAVAAAVAAPARAVETAPRPAAEVIAAREAVVLFYRMCMMSGGHRKAVEPMLDGLPEDALVRRMSVDRVADLHAGQSGGAGWTLTSPNGTGVVIDFAPDGRCSARVARADVAVLDQAAEQMMQALIRDGKSRLSKTLDTRPGEDGALRRRVDYVLSATGQPTSATVSVTTGEDASGTIGVLSFAVSRPPA